MAHRIILVLVKGGRDSITPLKAIHTWYNKRYILPIWVIICYIPPFTRTWKICWTTATVVQWLIPNIRRDKNMLLYILQFFPESEFRNSSADAFIYICFVSSRIFTTSQASIPLVTVHLKLWCCLMMSARHFWWLVWLNVTWCLSLVGSPRQGRVDSGWIFGWGLDFRMVGMMFSKWQVWTCPDSANVREVFMYAITDANLQDS